MGICRACGNDYDKTFEVLMHCKSYSFDCFECAVHYLAPRCVHCDLRIIGHGVEADGQLYCCANCAKLDGIHALRDRRDIYISSYLLSGSGRIEWR